MSTTTVSVRLLASLRHLNMRAYFQVLRAICETQAELDLTREAVAAHAISQEGDGADDLTELLATPEYRELLDALNDTDSAAALVTQTLLENAEYEARLSRLKETSLVDYVEELREITEEEIVAAILDGTVVNSNDEFGDARRIPSDEQYSGMFLARPTATAKLDTSVLLNVLNHFSSAQNTLVPSAQGLRLQQVVLLGDGLNLNWLKLPFPLGFAGCDFYAWVSAVNFSVPWLSFESCDFTPHAHAFGDGSGAFNAEGICVEHELRIWDCYGLKQLFIPASRIGTFSLRHPSNEVSNEAQGESATPHEKAFRTVIDEAHFGTLIIPEFNKDEPLLPIDLTTTFSLDSITGTFHSIVSWLQLADADPSTWDSVAEALARSGRSEEATDLLIAYKRYRNGEHDLLRHQAKQSQRQVTRLAKLERRAQRTGSSGEFSLDEIQSRLQDETRTFEEIKSLRDAGAEQHLSLAAKLDPRRRRRKNPIARFFVWLFADFTVRYFHKPFRAIWLLVATFMVTWIVAFAFHDQLIKSPLANEPIPSDWLHEITSSIVWSFTYALDSSFSPLSLGQADTMWPGSIWLVLTLAVLKATSIILLGLFLAAVTNLVSKRGNN